MAGDQLGLSAHPSRWFTTRISSRRRATLCACAIISDTRGFAIKLSQPVTKQSHPRCVQPELPRPHPVYRSIPETRPMHASLPAPRKELEVKLDVAPDSLRALKNIPLLRAQNGASKRRVEVSVYFDTDDHKLRKKGLMLRVRRVGGRYIQTIKANGHSVPLERDEWEAEIAGREPDLRLAEGHRART